MSQQAAADIVAVGAAQDHVNGVVVHSRTSFYWAMRLLPEDKRQAMFAVYAFCRVVDDIADGDLPSAAKLGHLQGWSDEIDRLFAGRPQHPIAMALVEPVRSFRLAREDFLAIIEGMAMDANAPIVAPTLAELQLYCARVAGAVGLLSVRIFGAPPAKGPALAHALGEAVQLTNVLRDVEEDARLGRHYLPRELLEKHGVPITSPMAMLKDAKLPAVCAELGAIAEQRFAQAAALLAAMPRKPLRPARIILVVYRRLLERLRQGGFAPVGNRVSLSKAEKLWLVLRHGVL